MREGRPLRYHPFAFVPSKPLPLMMLTARDYYFLYTPENARFGFLNSSLITRSIIAKYMNLNLYNKF